MSFFQKVLSYVKAGVATVAGFFKKNPDVTNAAIAIAAFDAGYLLATKKPEIAPKAMVIVSDIITRLNSGTQTEIINQAFKDGVIAIIGLVKDPLIQMNLMSFLAVINFDATNMNLPALPLSAIKDFSTKFRDGLQAGMAVKK